MPHRRNRHHGTWSWIHGQRGKVFLETFRSRSTHRCSTLLSRFSLSGSMLSRVPHCALALSKSAWPDWTIPVGGVSTMSSSICRFVRARTLNHPMYLVSVVLAAGRQCQQCEKLRILPTSVHQQWDGPLLCSREHDVAGSFANRCVRVEAASVHHEVTQDARGSFTVQVPLSAPAAV